jgi:hypothetical protein
MAPVEILLIWIDVFLSIMFISSVWKDNIFSQIAQNVAIGAAIGHAILIAIDTIYRSGIASVLAGSTIAIIGIIFGVLMFGRFTPYKWLARYPTQLVMSVGLGVMFGLSIQTQIFQQIIATMQGLLSPADSLSLLWAILIFIGMSCTLAYFLFTFPPFVTKQKTRGAYGFVRKIARVFMMISFGMTFAGEEIWYLGVLIGRLWLIWKHALPTLGI